MSWKGVEPASRSSPPSPLKLTDNLPPACYGLPWSGPSQPFSYLGPSPALGRIHLANLFAPRGYRDAAL